MASFFLPAESSSSPSYYGWNKKRKKKKKKGMETTTDWSSKLSTKQHRLLPKLMIVTFISLLCSASIAAAEKNKHCKFNSFYVLLLLTVVTWHIQFHDRPVFYFPFGLRPLLLILSRGNATIIADCY